MDAKIFSQESEPLAARFGIKTAENLLEYPFVQNKIRLIPYQLAKKWILLPLEEKDGVIILAITNLGDLSSIEEVRILVGKKTTELYAPKEKIEEAIERCYRQDKEETSKFFQSLHKQNLIHQEEEGFDLLDQKADSPIIRMLNVIFVEAIQQGASDIHFEPLENDLVVRYRIDGILQERHRPPKDYQNQLLTRIKVLSKLDIAESRRPQDGRIKLGMGNRQIDFRVSTVPVAYGERIVLRILDKSNVALGLDKIGINSMLLKKFRKYIRQNQGIILVTGPTGSGKTTTLYSALSEMNSSELNIMTIEDPVEYKLQGMAQIQVNTKIDLDFATGLRHILRQDPDVIMIGEIRDKETAEIAIQSSLTGHLVLSTLHTNDAPSALTRLIDMGIEPYLLSSSVILVIAQRLVRKICSACAEPYLPSEQELLEMGIEQGGLSEHMLLKGKGCSSCFYTGFKGRHGIYELMPITQGIKRQLLKSPDATDLQHIALQEGMFSLKDEGVRLALLGVTTISEVQRVARNIEV